MLIPILIVSLTLTLKTNTFTNSMHEYGQLKLLLTKLKFQHKTKY